MLFCLLKGTCHVWLLQSWQPCFLTLNQKIAKFSDAQGGPASWYAHKKVVWPLGDVLTTIFPMNYWESKGTLTSSQREGARAGGDWEVVFSGVFILVW